MTNFTIRKRCEQHSSWYCDCRLPADTTSKTNIVMSSAQPTSNVFLQIVRHTLLLIWTWIVVACLYASYQQSEQIGRMKASAESARREHIRQMAELERLQIEMEILAIETERRKRR